MAQQLKPGAVLKTKKDELVLEKFFYEYITVWFREHIISVIQYENAREEIDLLKSKTYTKEKQKNAETIDAISSDLIGEQQNPVAALKTKSYFVLEKFFDEYIAVWYREHAITAVQYAKARKEIDLLKSKTYSKEKQKNVEGTDEDIAAVKQLSSSFQRKSDALGRPKLGRCKGVPVDAENQRKIAVSNCASNDESRHMHDLQSLRQQNEELVQRVNYLKSKIYVIRADAHTELKEKDDKIEKLKKLLENSRSHNDDLSIRKNKLAEDICRQGNPDIADLSDSHRPTRISKLFSEVYDNEWPEAFENIPDMEENKKVRILHWIVMNAFSFCKERIEEQNRAIENVLTKSNEGQTGARMHKEIKESLDRLRKQLLKEMAEEVAQDFATRSLQGLMITYSIKLDGKDTTVRRYALKCAEICWLLLVFLPELSVSQDEVGLPFDQNIYKSYTRRVPDYKHPTIGLCVWPALFQGSIILVKGVAEPMETKRKPLDLQR